MNIITTKHSKKLMKDCELKIIMFNQFSLIAQYIIVFFHIHSNQTFFFIYRSSKTFEMCESNVKTKKKY